MNKYFSIYQGIVVSNDDPMKLGRCKIKVPSVHGSITAADYDLLPWAIYISPNATGSNRTTFILPKVGDIVWVQFIAGDKATPAYFGSSFGEVNGVSEIPVQDSEYFNTDVLYSSGDGVKIFKNSLELKIQFNDSYISINKNGCIDINSSGDIVINGKTIRLN